MGIFAERMEDNGRYSLPDSSKGLVSEMNTLMYGLTMHHN